MPENPKHVASSARGDGHPPGGRAARPPENAVGEERPAFLLQFPDDPELERLIRAFEEGNFAKVRAEAPELARRSTDEAVRRAARELRQRIDPDPLLVVLLVFALSLFAFLVVWIYTQ
jgi:hypothetical protein